MSKSSKIQSQKNPLATEPKREKSGSGTYRKYNYQYHWALCRMLDEHAKGNHYAVFVEEHEDVTLADSLDPGLAKFEFNQVKEKGSKFTIAGLIKKNKGSSVLVKMAEGACDKSFSEKIKEVNLVSTGGFKFDLHDKGYSYEVIKTGDLSQDELNTLRTHLITEFGSDDLLNCLAFVVPDLPAKGFDAATKGRISDLVNKISPRAHCNPQIIYSCVIEDLQRKGENMFDYKMWDQAIKRKAVTSEQVQNIINQNTTRKGDEKLQSELIEILKDEFGLSSVKRRNIQKAFQRYYENRLGDRSLLLNNISAEITDSINKVVSGCADAKELVELVSDLLTDEVKDYFNSEEEISAAILYEYMATE